MTTSFVQGFFKPILPKKPADDMEAESKSWKMQCPDSKHERSYWELGGIRRKAAGHPRKYRYCINCGKTTRLMVYRKTMQIS